MRGMVEQGGGTKKVVNAYVFRSKETTIGGKEFWKPCLLACPRNLARGTVDKRT